MDINLKAKNIIFIEETVFLVDGFYELIKQVVSNLNHRELEIYIDRQIKKTIENYHKMGQARKAYQIEGFIDVLEELNLIRYVNTFGYFNIDELKTLVQNNQDAYVLFFTQKTSLFRSLVKIKDVYPFILIAKYENNDVVLWKQIQQNHMNAFYIDEKKYLKTNEFKDLDYVYSPKYGYLKLDKTNKYVGGEGILYGTYENMLCKLYYKENLTYTHYKKLQHMLTLDIYNPYINWPKDIVYYKNQFIGYLMDEISNALTLDEIRLNRFKGFSIIERYMMAYQFLKQVDYLHQKNIIIGDLKLDNILISSPKEVYLIDSGCYQIEDYPCIVCHPEYTKKNYTTEELRKELRTIEDEYYPINKILFEILIGKKPNYNRNNGEVTTDNNNEFYFPLDLKQIKDPTPEMKLWGVLSERMREFFYYYFKEDKITPKSEWLDELQFFIETAMKQKERG